MTALEELATSEGRDSCGHFFGISSKFFVESGASHSHGNNLTIRSTKLTLTQDFTYVA